MKRHVYAAALGAVGLVLFGMCGGTSAQNGAVPSDVAAALKAAQIQIDATRQALAASKVQLDAIPEDSAYIAQVKEMLQVAERYWGEAKDALEGARMSVDKIGGAAPSISKDYQLLAKVSANVARSGAEVVQISLSYIQAVANQKTESLEIIGRAMTDAQAAASQVKSNFDRVKKAISGKYSK